MTECYPSEKQIYQPAMFGDIKKQISRLWGLNKWLTHNPAPNPISLNRTHLDILKTCPYVVSEKSDGVRYLLLISRFSRDKRPFAVLIDRAFKMFQIEMFAPKEVFRGSLFDGELVWDTKSNSMKFLVFDVISVSGRLVGKHNFLQRYEIIQRHFLSEKEWNRSHIKDFTIATETASVFAKNKKIVPIPTSEKILFFYSKPVVNFQTFGCLVRSSRDLSHKSDGFLFTPINCKVMCNTHYTMFKWKFSPTIDFQIEKVDLKSFRFYCQVDKHQVELTSVFPDFTFEFEPLRGFLFTSGAMYIVETTIKEHKKNVFVCSFHRIRSDKKYPNNKKTIVNIIQEIRENITIDELVMISKEKC
jgi:hypothetical protein